MKYNGVSATIQTRIKISCDSEGVILTCKISVTRESMGSRSKFFYLPLGAHKDVCTCHLRAILSPPAPWFTFRADSPMNPMQKLLSSTKSISVAVHFLKSASFLLLQALNETLQSVATVKCASDRSAYKGTKHGYRI